MRHDRNGNSFIALTSRGAILPPQFLSRVAALQASLQAGTDYGLSKSLNLKDEIARYWRIANDLFNAYKERCVRTDLDHAKVAIDEWLVPLLRDVFGYEDLTTAKVLELGERRFPITHQAFEDAVPFVLTTNDVYLDRAEARFGDTGRRRSPHALMQELLNASDSQLWGAISNGTRLRLLRENASISRPSYIEADLQQIFQEQIYSDFAALWLLLHASRLRPSASKESHSILEAWRAQANEEGERALGQLRDGVTQALLALGNGFLEFPTNEKLRAAIADSSLTADSLFQELLRLVYRLLFLFAAEERYLLHIPGATDDQRALYRDGFAVANLRERALRRRHYDRHKDLWSGLGIVFRALALGQTALGLPALGGLFAAEHCSYLDDASITNARLLEAIKALAFFRSGVTLTTVNYRDMGAEELGSVYESLLELHPVLKVDVSPWTFNLIGAASNESAKGSTRRLTGSYYTPTPLVDELIKSTLDPVIAAAMEQWPEDPRRALLDLKVLDPACGSGHFLLAAARRLATEIARIEAGSDAPEESARQHALRDVVQHCIHGVDRNPLAVELCKTSLWIETVEPGKPLTFLDSHILCGDSLVGVLDPADLNDGIPDDAYKPLTGDDAAACRDLKRRNRSSGSTVQGSLFDQDSLKAVVTLASNLDAMSEETLDDVTRKREAWIKVRNDTDRRREELRANLFVGAFFAPKRRDTLECVPLTEDLNRLDRDMTMRAGVEDFVDQLAARLRFFHWHVAFPDAMRQGGFDAILGNPPWDVSELDEEEYFAVRAPHIANLTGVSRKRAISALAQSDPRLWDAYRADLQRVEASNAFARGSARFGLTAHGKLNTYALFAETFLGLVSRRGQTGFVVPTGIATDSSTKAFFGDISTSGKIVSLLSFENEEFIFPAVHNAFKFCLLTLRGTAAPETAARYVFFARQTSALREPDRQILLTRHDIELMNPNTRTALIFRSKADAELTKKIYSNVPVLSNERSPQEDRWAIEFRQGLFNMSSDSNLFRTVGDFASTGARRQGVNWLEADGDMWVPLVEGKMIDLYDHRASTYEGRGDARGVSRLPRTSDEQHADKEFEPLPYYWVRAADIESQIPRQWKHKWLFGFRDVTSAVNERTFICSFLPRLGPGHTLPLLFQEAHPRLQACLLANLSSLVFDYVARQKLGGFHMSFFYVAQFPVLPPRVYNNSVFDFVVPRVLELSYTSTSMQPFAEDLGFDGPPFTWHSDRRALLRAQLDAFYAKLYGLKREELRYILDPSDALGPDYPSETFRVLKERENAELGEYRTARLVLEAWDSLERDARSTPKSVALT